FSRHLTVGTPATTAQHDLRPHRQPMSRFATCRPALQRCSVLRSHSQLRHRTTATRRNSPTITTWHCSSLSATSGTGHYELNGGGHATCAWAVTRSERWRPGELLRAG